MQLDLGVSGCNLFNFTSDSHPSLYCRTFIQSRFSINFWVKIRLNSLNLVKIGPNFLGLIIKCYIKHNLFNKNGKLKFNYLKIEKLQPETPKGPFALIYLLFTPWIISILYLLDSLRESNRYINVYLVYSRSEYTRYT